MPQLSLDNLRTFVSIVDLGGFTRAGEQLGRSQPAISLQLKKLEQQLGKRLLYKTGIRHQPTGDGLQLYQQAKTMLALNDEIFRQFTQPQLRGRLRLGIPSEFATTLLPSIVGEFSQLYPDVSLEVTSSLSKTLLAPGHIQHFDLILALMNPEQKHGGEQLLSDELVWVGDKRKPLSDKHLSLVLAPDGCIYRSRVINKLKQQTVSWRITYSDADLSGIGSAIQQGLGVTALAKSSVPKHLDIVQHPLLPKLGQVNICLFRPDSRHPQAVGKLAEFIREKLS